MRSLAFGCLIGGGLSGCDLAAEPGGDVCADAAVVGVELLVDSPMRGGPEMEDFLTDGRKG
jgi:hypothetical protein